MLTNADVFFFSEPFIVLSSDLIALLHLSLGGLYAVHQHSCALRGGHELQSPPTV